MGNLERLTETCIELGYAKTLDTLGISSGEISQRRARDVYGKYFIDAARAELKQTKSLYNMKKVVKKAVEVILTIIACVSFILMTAERPDGSCCLPWTLGWLSALVVSSIILNKMGVFKKEESR